MPIFDSKHLAARAQGHWWRGVPVEPITGFSIDTRTLKPGDLFVAVSGGERDGHDFLKMALAAGASGAIVERRFESIHLPQLLVRDSVSALQDIARWHRDNFPGKVFSVTGSNGKTTTKDLLRCLLGEETVYATEGNLNNHLGVPLSVLRLASEKHQTGVFETGISRPGDMAPLAAILQPDGVIATNIGPAHLEGLKSEERVAAEKSVLPAAVRVGGWCVHPSTLLKFPGFKFFPSRQQVIVHDQGTGEPLNLPELASGRGQNRAVWSYRMEYSDEQKTQIWIRLPSGEEELYELHPISRGVASCVGLALVACRLEGVSAEDARKRLSGWKGSKGRTEIFQRGGQWVYWDAYNANPKSMLDSLEAFERFAPDGKRFFLLGSMGELGEKASWHHFIVGQKINLREGDILVVMGDNGSDYLEGLLSRFDSGKGEHYLNPEPVLLKELLDDFHGAVFVKGSRFQRLERWIPPLSQESEPRKRGEAIPC